MNLWRKANERPVLAALVMIVAVAGPGYWRLEGAVNEAHDAAVDAQAAADTAQATADALRDLILEIEQDRRDRRLELCERDVRDRIDDRAMWTAGFVLFEGSPAVESLRADLEELLPMLVCTVDGVPVPVGG